MVIPAHGFRDIPTGVVVAFPPGWWGLITARSSTYRKRGLLVINGVIDGGYRGELLVGVANLTGEAIVIDIGDRLAQLIPMQSYPGGVEVCRDLPMSERGTRGFGSTDNDGVSR